MSINQDVDPAVYAAWLDSDGTSAITTTSAESQVPPRLDFAALSSQFLQSPQPTQSTEATQATQFTQLTQATQATQSSKPVRKKSLLLTKDEDIKLLQLMLSNANTYEISKMMTVWWNNVTKEFNRGLTRGVATNLARHVARLMKERELQLEMLVTGDEDETGPYIQAIDEWITIHKSHEDGNNMKKKNDRRTANEGQKSTKKTSWMDQNVVST